MSRPKPVGFDNFITHFGQSNDGSGSRFYKKASFFLTEGGYHKFYRGPSIVSATAAASMVTTTAEAHKLKVGDPVRFRFLPVAYAGLMAADAAVTVVGSPTTFTVGFNSSALAALGAVGIVGVQMRDLIVEANYNIVEGGNCLEEYPAAWELPLEG